MPRVGFKLLSFRFITMSSIKNLKSFVGIKFLDRSNDVIPRLWITGKGSSMKCAWRSLVDGSPDLLAKIKAQPQVSWKFYKFEYLCQTG